MNQSTLLGRMGYGLGRIADQLFYTGLSILEKGFSPSYALYGLFVILFFSPPFLLGQANKETLYLDSLKQQLRSSPFTSIEQLNVLCLLATKYASTRADSARHYAHSAIAVSDDLAQAEYQGKAWKTLAHVDAYSGHLDSLDISYHISKTYLNDCTSLNCQSYLIDLEFIYGYSFNDRGQHKRAIEILKPALRMPNISEAQYCLGNIHLATCHLELGDIDEAFKYIVIAKEKARLINNDDLQYKALYVYSWGYWSLGDLNKTLEVNKEMLSLAKRMGRQNQIKSSLFSIARTYSEISNITGAISTYEKLLAISNDNLQDSYYNDAIIGLLKIYSTKNPTLAAYYAEKLEIALNKNLSYRVIHVRRNMLSALATYYLQLGKTQKAEKYARQNLDFIRRHQPDTASIIANALEELSYIQAMSGQYQKAWYTLDTLYSLKQAITKRNQHTATAKAAVELNLAENELARQKAEQATLLEQQASVASSRFFIFLLVIAGLILAGVIWAYRRGQRDKQLISEKSQLLEQSLAEKEVLLREIHHRVKNNLQIISSLLDKQARKSSDEAVRKLVKEGQERIQSMALIHQNLYESEQLSAIDIKTYLHELSANIQRSQTISTDQVQLQLNIEDEKLDIDTAIPVGLILNELLTNCYKYAFPQKEKGRITVDFKKQDDQYFLKVSDNGIGFNTEKLGNKTKSLGLNLVNGLVRQLEGSIEWQNIGQGAVVAIHF